MHLFSTRHRPVHLGPFPHDRLVRRSDLAERTPHPRGVATEFDASMADSGAIAPAAWLAAPLRNPCVAAWAGEPGRGQPTSFALALDMILADVLESARKPQGPFVQRGHAIVLRVEPPRDPRPDEPGGDWIPQAQAQRADPPEAQVAVLLSSHLRLLGHEGRAHSATCSERVHERILCCSRARHAAGVLVIDLKEACDE